MYYRVTTNRNYKTSDFLFHGYETEHDYRCALSALVDRWGGRVGEAVGNRHDYIHLRFRDTPGGRPDEAWMPRFLLEPTTEPDYLRDDKNANPILEELDRAFGFD